MTMNLHWRIGVSWRDMGFNRCTCTHVWDHNLHRGIILARPNFFLSLLIYHEAVNHTYLFKLFWGVYSAFDLQFHNEEYDENKILASIPKIFLYIVTARLNTWIGFEAQLFFLICLAMSCYHRSNKYKYKHISSKM